MIDWLGGKRHQLCAAACAIRSVRSKHTDRPRRVIARARVIQRQSLAAPGRLLTATWRHLKSRDERSIRPPVRAARSLSLSGSDLPVARTALDSLLFRDAFGTPEVRDRSYDRSTVARCIDVEVALSRAEARCGVKMIEQVAPAPASESCRKHPAAKLSESAL
jgi:hypothetical protein